MTIDTLSAAPTTHPLRSKSENVLAQARGILADCTCFDDQEIAMACKAIRNNPHTSAAEKDRAGDLLHLVNGELADA